MISIRESISDLEKSEQLRALVLDCYLSALRNLADYAVELEEEVTAAYRSHVTSLTREVEKGEPEAISESRSSLRGLLRDFRDKGRRYIHELKSEMGRTAQALQRLIDSMSHYDGDHESRLRQALKTIRELAQQPAAAPVAQVLRAVGNAINEAMAEFRQQQQLTISQFMGEISQLHERINALESEASKDELTKLFNRSEIEARLRLVETGGSLLLLNVQGVRLAAVQFGGDVAEQLAAALVKRLRNTLTPEATLGRWSEEEFLVLHPAAKNEAVAAAKQLTQALSGTYACQQGGKTVRPALQVGVAVLDFGPGGSVENTMQRIKQFFKV